MTIMVTCPNCAGTGWASCGDRHAETITDCCRPCKGVGKIEAATGERRTAAFNPATSLPFGEALVDLERVL